MSKTHTRTTWPNHVAVILDGNGRWATKRGRPRTLGHVKGAMKAMKILEHAVRLEIPVVTLWGFSTDNWKRPENEVQSLMGLFQRFAVRQAHKLDLADIRVTFIGNRTQLPRRLQRAMREVEVQTADNTGLHLRPAINYSADQEYADAANRVSETGAACTRENIAAEIWGETPPYDLIIRTGGETRLSGFPDHRAELHFSDKLWPEFTVDDFNAAISAYEARERRQGAVAAA